MPDPIGPASSPDTPERAILARRDYAAIQRADAALIEKARRALRLSEGARVFVSIQPVGLPAEACVRLDSVLGLGHGLGTLDAFLAAEARWRLDHADRLEAGRHDQAP